MSIQTRPSDTITKDNLLIGMPFVEYAPALSGGGFGAFRNLGIINEAAFVKEIETVALRSAQSGTEVLIRELVRRFEARLNVDIYQFTDDNLQLLFASTDITTVSGGTTTITNESVTLPATVNNWADLANVSIVDPVTSVDPDTITAEAVGTGDGAANNFSLDFKPLDHLDVSSITVGATTYTPVAVGAAAAGNEVEVTDFVDNAVTAGALEFFVGGVSTPPPNGDDIVATYLPTHTLVENTDYVIDYVDGRIRRVSGNNLALKESQPLLVDYDYNVFDESQLTPFTQFVFSGKARVRHLTDVGINIIWEIPSVDVRLSDDDFAFNREEFTTSTLTLTLVEDSAVAGQPYGLMRIFDEPTATP